MENIIHVNIDPILISFGNWVVSWHGFFSFLGVLFAVALVGEWAKDYRVEKEDIFHVAVWGIIGGVIGARIVHVIDYWWFYGDLPLEIFKIWKGGIGVWGGVLGGFLGGVLCSHINKYPKYIMTDIAAPALLFAMVIGRLGDIVNGEHCSKAYEGLFAFSWDHPNSDAANCKMKGSGIGVPVQPAIMYEMIWNLLSVYAIWYLRFKLHPHGMTWVLFIILYSFGRFFISFLRYDRIWAMGLTEAQWIAVACIVVCLPIIIINLNYNNFNTFQLLTDKGKTRAERRRSVKKSKSK